MASITFDKLAYTHSLRAGGFSEQQAEASAHALDLAFRDSVATREDLRRVEERLSAETAALRSEMAQGFVEVRGELRHQIIQQKADLQKWIIPLFLGQAALIGALIKLL